MTFCGQFIVYVVHFQVIWGPGKFGLKKGDPPPPWVTLSPCFTVFFLLRGFPKAQLWHIFPCLSKILGVQSTGNWNKTLEHTSPLWNCVSDKITNVLDPRFHMGIMFPSGAIYRSLSFPDLLTVSNLKTYHNHISLLVCQIKFQQISLRESCFTW